MKERVLEIVQEEINKKLEQIRKVPSDNLGMPNTELHFKTSELLGMQTVFRRLEEEL